MLGISVAKRTAVIGTFARFVPAALHYLGCNICPASAVFASPLLVGRMEILMIVERSQQRNSPRLQDPRVNWVSLVSWRRKAFWPVQMHERTTTSKAVIAATKKHATNADAS